MATDNSVHPHPSFSAHRRVAGTVSTDNTDLVALLAEPGGARRSAHAKGWDSVDGFVELSAGTVDLQPLLLVEYDGVERFIELGSPITTLADGDHFNVTGVHGGRIFLRVNAVSSAADLVVYLAGGARSNEGSI